MENVLITYRNEYYFYVTKIRFNGLTSLLLSLSAVVIFSLPLNGLVRILQVIPVNFFKHFEGTDGLYEIRIIVGSDILEYSVVLIKEIL